MKLEELINKIMDDKSSEDFDLTLTGKELIKIKDFLIQCDEFKESELIIMDTPFAENEGGSPIDAASILIKDNLQFKNKVYLYSIGLTPTMYDPKNWNDPFNQVKDNASISNKLYDPKDFMPFKLVTIRLDGELLENIEKVDSPDRRDSIDTLHRQLNNIISNPTDYQIKGKRGIIVRGIFETVVDENGDTKHNKFGKLNIDASKFEYYKVFSLEKETIDNEVTLKVISNFIPKRLKDKFSEKFGTKLEILSKKEIDDFITENK